MYVLISENDGGSGIILDLVSTEDYLSGYVLAHSPVPLHSTHDQGDTASKRTPIVDQADTDACKQAWVFVKISVASRYHDPPVRIARSGSLDTY